MEPTTSHRPLGDLPTPAGTVPPRDLRPMTRLTVLALILWAVIDVLHTTFAVGHYEHRITVVTHGNADVAPAWMVYELFRHLMPYGMANTVADRSWVVGSLVAAAAFITWLYHARRDAERLGGAPAWPVLAGSWWASVLVTLLLHGIGWLYRTVTSHGGMFEQTALDTRWVAYPLWTAATVMTVITATRTARLVRRGVHERTQTCRVGR